MSKMERIVRTEVRRSVNRLLEDLCRNGFERDASEVLDLVRKSCELEKTRLELQSTLERDNFGVLEAMVEEYANRFEAVSCTDHQLVVLGLPVEIEDVSQLLTSEKEESTATLTGFGAPAGERRFLRVSFRQDFKAKSFEYKVVCGSNTEGQDIIVDLEGGWACETHALEEAKFSDTGDATFIECAFCESKKHPLRLELDIPQQLFTWVTGSKCEIPPHQLPYWVFVVLMLCPFSEGMRWKLADMVLPDQDSEEESDLVLLEDDEDDESMSESSGDGKMDGKRKSKTTNDKQRKNRNKTKKGSGDNEPRPKRQRR